MKDKIIYHTLEFLDTNDLNHANKAKEYLTELAKKYHIKIKKQIKTDVKAALKGFVFNGPGYQVTIPKLYNAL